MKAPQLVCLLGAECTGKTTLARQLAEQFSSLWVGEYLRAFCDEKGRTPTRAEQPHILQTQALQEEQVLEQARLQQCAFVFCDTAPLLTAIYSDYCFADDSLYAQARSLHSRYALTLLLEPDIPWQADGLQRDGAHVRGPVHALIARELAALPGLTVRIAGTGPARFAAAKRAIDLFCGRALWTDAHKAPSDRVETHPSPCP
jgi:nicotinamide riboside kinase